jgi:hypothetical protein
MCSTPSTRVSAMRVKGGTSNKLLKENREKREELIEGR